MGAFTALLGPGSSPFRSTLLALFNFVAGANAFTIAIVLAASLSEAARAHGAALRLAPSQPARLGVLVLLRRCEAILKANRFSFGGW